MQVTSAIAAVASIGPAIVAWVALRNEGSGAEREATASEPQITQAMQTSPCPEPA
jgi:hypothetical protein